MATKRPAQQFEKNLTALEQVVEALESGDLSLEDSLKAYEQGVKLTRECQAALAQAEQRLAVISEQDGEIVSTPVNTQQD